MLKMVFIEGAKYIVKKKKEDNNFFKVGDVIIFKGEFSIGSGLFTRDSDNFEQIVDYEDVGELSEGYIYDYDDCELEAVEYVENTELIAKVNFKGFGEPRARYKTYHFKTTISDLEKGEIVIVDSNGEFQCANFLGYLKEGEVHVSPTKYIINRFTTESVQSKKLDRYALESRGVKKVSEKTEILFMEIEAFHKKVLIDKYLDERNFEGLRELL